MIFDLQQLLVFSENVFINPDRTALNRCIDFCIVRIVLSVVLDSFFSSLACPIIYFSLFNYLVSVVVPDAYGSYIALSYGCPATIYK